MEKLLSTGTILLLLTGSVLFSGCKKEGCTDPVATNYDSKAKKDDGLCEYAVEEISGTYSSPLTLEDIFDDPSQVDYIVTGDIIMESDLVIRPGVVIQVNAGKSISIFSNGSINASGTGDNPILITGAQKSPGAWRYILLQSKSSQNVFRHVTLEYGGSDNYGGNLYVVHDGEFKMTNSTVRHSKNHGIAISNSNSSGTFIPEFSNNIFSNNGTYAITINAEQMNAMDRFTKITDNGIDMIRITGGKLSVATEVSKASVPYLINNTITIEADVKLDPGVHFLMGAGVSIDVKASGSLNAEGTSANKIIIHGANESKGYFRNIYLASNSSKNIFDHVEAGYGGSDIDGGNIYIEGGTLSMSNSYIHNSASWGVRVSPVAGGTFTDLGGNSYNNNESGDNG